MGTVLIALLPAFAVGIYQFGFRVVTLTAVFVASCVLFEYLYNKITKKPQTVGDLSAVLTGVLLAFNCPSSLPYEIAIVGSFAAIVVIKQLFGGIGQNPVSYTHLNPNPIRTIGVWIEQNLVSIISSAIRNARTTRRLVLDFCSIKKLLSLFVVD